MWCSHLLETHVSVRKVDRRVLATDIDAELGLITCVWDRIGGPSQNGVTQVVQSDSSQWRR